MTNNIARQPFVLLDDRADVIHAQPPAVIMCDPKFTVNVAQMIRNCASFGIDWLFLTGNRLELPAAKGKGRNRMPRQERMREYRTVQVVQSEFPIRWFNQQDIVPIGVELARGAIPLPVFAHPKNAIYILGPEDGSIPAGMKALCHTIVQIPTRHCLNVAMAGGIVLYDRIVNRWRNGQGALPELAENRGWE